MLRSPGPLVLDVRGDRDKGGVSLFQLFAPDMKGHLLISDRECDPERIPRALARELAVYAEKPFVYPNLDVWSVITERNGEISGPKAFQSVCRRPVPIPAMVC
ncbi:hypothetical protein M427DRAFT_160644 [Gonapodya prolifera JEL478]|uniref:Uncharacterized protein n=1 Tax=Gonapodya prolifera (strain JEL478) TaxID=1344416 RepID=A0A138ZY76_GONPJ|nr:hypothetical protein M427DRAFT_160644 [Gonapodya prolifera JEL478]|eukprot:KXS09458.1 hypothetical protein M427DRAFT_160644 [Gonapodya prolifera JEL478]